MLILENKFSLPLIDQCVCNTELLPLGGIAKQGMTYKYIIFDATEYAGIITWHILQFCKVALLYSGKHLKMEGLFGGCSSSFFPLHFFFSPSSAS